MADKPRCKRCKEAIAKDASVCKTCGQEQNNIVYWIKQVGTPIGLTATVVSVSISAAAYIRAASQPIPSAQLAVTSFELDSEADVLEIEMLNYGNAPARIRSVLMQQRFEYSIGGHDRYDGAIDVVSQNSVPPGDYATIELDLTQFSSRSAWSGTLNYSRLPASVRKPFQHEADLERGSFSYSYSDDCTLTFWTDGLNASSDTLTVDRASRICRLIIPYAIDYFERSIGFVEVE